MKLSNVLSILAIGISVLAVYITAPTNQPSLPEISVVHYPYADGHKTGTGFVHNPIRFYVQDANRGIAFVKLMKEPQQEREQLMRHAVREAAAQHKDLTDRDAVAHSIERNLQHKGFTVMNVEVFWESEHAK